MEHLKDVELVVDQIYGGSRKGNYSDDPLPSLIGVDNGAGFRHLGKRPHVETLKLLALKSNFNEPDWPDHLEMETGVLTYFGDNRKPGDLHKTPRKGNLILSNLFAAAHNPDYTNNFPPILVFGGTGIYRDVRFLGLAVPGAEHLDQDDDLVALWRSTGSDNIRFQNYRAKFTILDISVISREWITDIQAGNAASSEHAPQVWLNWLHNRKYKALCAPHTHVIRNKQQQLPQTADDKKILDAVYQHYKDDPFAFEKCAVEIAKLMMSQISDVDLTRPWRDGGRDATGLYQIGEGNSAIKVEFALEAKCYIFDRSIGVKHTSRLISRLRHRQFGILVTTSYLHDQAYKELKEDGHPVVIICGMDIVKVLKERIGPLELIHKWLAGLTIN